MLGIATGARLSEGRDRDTQLDWLRAIGCTAIRWTLPWTGGEAVMGSGVFDFSASDAMIAALAAREMRVLITTGSRGDGDLFAADHVAAIEPWCKAVGARYGAMPTVIGFEGPNEMNLQKASQVQTPELYVACQTAVYRGYKAGAPLAVVGNGGIVGSYKVLDPYYAAGLGAVIDMLIWHPYTHPLSPTQSMAQSTRGWYSMIQARKVMVAHGDAHKQMWITEYGTNTAGTNPSTEQVQADDLRDAVHRFRSHAWAGPMFTFTGWDASPITNDPGDSMGLLHADGTEKPAAGVFRELAAAA